jgi:hypothetical protein
VSRHRLPRARTSTVAPFVPGEDAQDRHQRRLEVAMKMADLARWRLAELGLTLKISPDGGQHWQVRDHDGRIAEWWPQTGRFVALGNYRQPQKFHDVLGFVGAVRRGRRP